MEHTKGELKIDLRDILREFYGQMKELQKFKYQSEFNKGLDVICTYDEAIKKVLERTAAPALYEALKSLLWDLRQRAIPNDLTEFEQVLAKAEEK